MFFVRLAVLIFTALIGVGPARALDWKTMDGGRWAGLPAAAAGQAGFTAQPPDVTGIRFTNRLDEWRGLTNQLLMSGSGVACGDADGDGWVDLYFCGLDSPNALYRNRGGWKFEDITGRAGVGCTNQASTGAAFADVDGDGDLDLLVNAFGGGTRLFLNDGKAVFTEGTAAAGLAGKTASLSMALADVEGDGDLDLFVANYRPSLLQDEPDTEIHVGETNGVSVIVAINKRPPTAADLERFTLNPATMSIVEHGEADAFYLNDGRGRFTPVSWTNGVFLNERGAVESTPLDWGLSVMMRDFNGDGAPDIYVCNDMDSVDRFWLNDGKGRFRAASMGAVRHTSLASMGVDVADVNRDGHDDFVVVDMLAADHVGRQTLLAGRTMPGPPGSIHVRPQYYRNTLFLGRGDGTFAEIAQLAGLDATDWTWMPLFLDVDLDGYEDLLISTGMERSFRDADARQRIDAARGGQRLTGKEFFELRRMLPRLETPNFAFRNRGGLAFEQVSAAWGFDSKQISQGMALADLDNDGDADVAVNCLNAGPLVYRNNSPAPRVAVRLRGAGANTRGIGARMRLFGGPVTQSQEMIAGGRYLSSDDPMRVFAAGAGTNDLTLEVTWRSGQRSEVRGVKASRIYEIDEASARPAVSPAKPSPRPLFRDVSHQLGHFHHEDQFNDFKLQPLLPRRLSQAGPGVSWCDIGGDGRDDLVIGSGRDGEPGLFLNDGQGKLGRVSVGEVIGRLSDDQTAVLAWRSATNATTLLFGLANYQSGVTNDPPLQQFVIDEEAIEAGEPLPGQEASAGPMALADVDGDGTLELFVGGRVIGGRYPQPASSRLFRQREGRFVLDTEQSRVFQGVGLVSGAVFTDLTGDGLPELVLACEWGPLRIFRNERGKLAAGSWAVQFHSSLDPLTGWWNSVTAADFDGDGRMDLAAGNWGRNTKHQRYLAHPLRIYYGDLNDDGILELIEGYHEASLQKTVPWQHWDTVARLMPWVQERFNSHRAFSTASVQDVFGDRMGEVKELSAAVLDSMVFLNRSNRFEAQALPVEAQFSPVFGLCAGDADGDGHEDLFLAQNFFGTDPETPRYDAGRGLWLKGDGRGGFTPLSTQASGVALDGEGRGAALGDFDADGRLDLAVGQNAWETKLYHNEGATPGLRVRLAGPPGNIEAIGAVMRLEFGGGQKGAAREVHAGSGYWSQDSAVLVMPTPVPPKGISVRWPGGKTTQTTLPAGAREVVLTPDGKLTVLK